MQGDLAESLEVTYKLKLGFTFSISEGVTGQKLEVWRG